MDLSKIGNGISLSVISGMSHAGINGGIAALSPHAKWAGKTIISLNVSHGFLSGALFGLSFSSLTSLPSCKKISAFITKQGWMTEERAQTTSKALHLAAAFFITTAASPFIATQLKLPVLSYQVAAGFAAFDVITAHLVNKVMALGFETLASCLNSLNKVLDSQLEKLKG